MQLIQIKMTRVKRGNVSRKRHKKILKLNKGFRGAASVVFRTANQQSMKALRSLLIRIFGVEIAL